MTGLLVAFIMGIVFGVFIGSLLGELKAYNHIAGTLKKLDKEGL